MNRDEIRIGQWVVYQAHEHAPREDGQVVRYDGAELAFVLYRGDVTPKATYITDLTAGEQP